MARLFPRHAVDRFLEHNVFYTIGQCTIQEGWNGFKRGASSSGGQTGRAHNFANNWPETGKLAFFWRIRRLVQSTSLRWRQSRLSQARQFIVRQNGRHIERTYEVLTRGCAKGTFLIALVN